MCFTCVMFFSSTECKFFSVNAMFSHCVSVSLENSRHFKSLPLITWRNDVRGRSSESPYWWCFPRPSTGQCCWPAEANFQRIKSSTPIWVVTGHRYGISALISQTSFRGGTNGGVYKCQLFPHAVVLDEILPVRHLSWNSLIVILHFVK